MRAIVLSGGGSKGAYQIGVWKAIRKLHIKYDIVTGTSVGALNATLMVQRDYVKAMMLWYNLNSSMVYGNDVEINENKDFVKYAKDIIKDGGMKVDSLSHTIDKYVNVKKVYSSPINFGIVTVKYPSLKALELRKEDIPISKFKDYLLASASCFPAFQKKDIDGDKYIDGGFHDNLPINLAISLGADEVIAVDLEAIGRKQKVKNKDVKITTISPRGDTGSFLVFNRISARASIALGYNDTMKTFGKLDGNVYTFKKGCLHSNYLKYKDAYLSNFNKIFRQKDEGFVSKLLQISVCNKILKDDDIKENKWNEMLEKTADILEINSIRIYSMSKFHYELFSSLESIRDDSVKSLEDNLSKHKLKLLFKENVALLYMYRVLLEGDVDTIYNLILIYPRAFLGALYLYSIHS